MIPDKAVETAVNARGRLNNPKWDNDIFGYEQFNEDQKAFLRGESRVILEAAAPFIRAEALRDAVDEVDTMWSGPAGAPYVSATKALLRSIADQWDGQ